MILRVIEARVCDDHSLELRFNNGAHKCVNVLPLLEGPIFAPLLDPAYFAQAEFDAVIGTVTWPNGADFAPEALFELPVEAIQTLAA